MKESTGHNDNLGGRSPSTRQELNVNILIADDHYLYVQGIRLLLEEHPDV